MEVSSAAAAISTLKLANVQAQASLSILRKTLDLQQAQALQLLQALPAPVQAPSGTVGTRIDIWA
ncbi:putative motility protein [Rhodocyclaceae bacterium SMB388]